MTDQKPKRRRHPARAMKHAQGDTQPGGTPAASSPSASRPLGTYPVHVRWDDLDAFNHVNNASYLVFLQETRLAWLRTVPGDWFSEHAVPVTASIELQYRKPITWPAEVDVHKACEHVGSTSITIANRIVDHADPAVVYAEGRVVLVWIDLATGTPVNLPDAIRGTVE